MSEFTLRRVQRKLQSDGLVSLGMTAVDLFFRKRVGNHVFDPAINRGIIQTITRQALTDRAINSVKITTDTVDEPAPFVSQLDAGYVLTETGLLTTPEFEIIEESAAVPKRARQAMMAMSSREFFVGHLPIRGLLTGASSANPKTLDTVAPLIPRYPANYYHWMVETVPKLRYLHKFEEQINTEVTILVPSGGAPFITETLDLLDWPTSKIVHAIEPIYKIRDLVVPSFPERTPADFNWLQGEILDAASTDKRRQTNTRDENNIYVSRANATTRRVLNEDAVMDVLSEYNFKRYHLEDRSLAENVRLFNQADVVVGPHGAGLTDIIFAGDCTLVELFGARFNKAYAKLCKSLRINYEPMYCQAKSTDIVVDTEKLDARVASVVE